MGEREPRRDPGPEGVARTPDERARVRAAALSSAAKRKGSAPEEKQHSLSWGDHPAGCGCRRCVTYRQQLRTLDHEGRPSRADEEGFADGADKKRREWERKREAELARRVEHAVRAIDHVRELVGPERRGTDRAIAHYMRRVRGLLESLRPGDGKPAD